MEVAKKWIQKQMNLSVYQIDDIKNITKITYKYCTLTTYLRWDIWCEQKNLHRNLKLYFLIVFTVSGGVGAAIPILCHVYCRAEQMNKHILMLLWTRILTVGEERSTYEPEERTTLWYMIGITNISGFFEVYVLVLSNEKSPYRSNDVQLYRTHPVSMI